MRIFGFAIAAFAVGLIGCATISPVSRIESNLIKLGMGEPRAECLANELGDELDRSDLNGRCRFSLRLERRIVCWRRLRSAPSDRQSACCGGNCCRRHRLRDQSLSGTRVSGEMPTSGFAHPPFEPVRTAFEKNFAENLEDGAHFAVIVNGQTVVSLYGGYTDRRRENVWEAGRIAGIFSCGKAALAMLVARAVSDGNLTYATPVAEVWPAFSAAGKHALTIADILSHQAGLVGFPDEANPSIWIDRDAVCARIEVLPPLFEPRAASGYAPQVGGFIIDEVLRRSCGASVREQLSDFGL